MEFSLKTRHIHKHENELKATGLLAFPMAWWTLWFVIAFIAAFIFSFTNVTLAKLANGGTISFTFVNYQRIFGFTSAKFDKNFWEAMKVTLIWTVVMTIGNNFMALLCAFLINSIKKGKKLFLGMLFWPSLVSGVVGSDVTKMVFGSQNSSLANKIVMAFGGEPIQWLTDKNFALISLMIMPFLLGFATKMLIYYSSLISIPDTYKEAAVLEIRSPFKIFLKITLPLMKNAVVLNLILSIIDGFKIMGPMQLITQGGYGTESEMLYIYDTAFKDGNIGRACAYATILFLIILIFTFIQRLISGKEVKSIE